jgi:hypothetical protein
MQWGDLAGLPVSCRVRQGRRRARRGEMKLRTDRLEGPLSLRARESLAEGFRGVLAEVHPAGNLNLRYLFEICARTLMKANESYLRGVGTFKYADLEKARLVEIVSTLILKSVTGRRKPLIHLIFYRFHRGSRGGFWRCA